VAKWTQFHNWVLVAFVNVGGGSNFRVEIIVWAPPIELIFCMFLAREITLCTWIMDLGLDYWCEASVMNFLLWMDNCVKDNNNRHLLTFLSFVMVKDVFEEVKLGFLVISHTHEDINGCFGYLSKKLKKENNYILVDLMRMIS
jgi:hypothetical protein